ncbi:HAMP domain-containing protein [Paenibacillus psychroresistens]|uniref:HAMP domain-containing protein n=1 Tax=Paenibacillus psychroresistens TaxID=1778678 RepID=A0A6B8RHV2_9BACL|nr:histidine kinase [Paenibacillus psychroresistens]QGQ95132.1 HAMP domain-containing protein [Paenibacillus psychroresistens]
MKLLYQRFISRKYFNKIFLVYMLITIATFFTMSYVTVNSTTSLIKEKELKYNDVIIHQIMSLLDAKLDTVTTLLKQTLIDKKFVQDIDYFMQAEYEPFSLKYIESKWIFDDYMSSAISRDPDIAGISVYKKKDSRIYEYSNTSVSYSDYEDYLYQATLQKGESSSNYTDIFGAHIPTYRSASSPLVFTISMKLKEDNLIDIAGLLLVDFNPLIFQNIISLQNDLGSEFIILTKNGDLIFDSTNKYYGKPYPYFNQIMQSGNSTVIDGVKTVLYKEVSSETGNVVVSLFPEKLILSKANQIRNKILLISLGCIGACILLMFAGSRLFSSRVSRITKHLKIIGTGNLSIRLPVKNDMDEFDEISISFNRMCEKLVDYIDRYYVLELKQKHSELKALQAQVNPHFLYNTLEAIRMKTVMSGDQSAAHMIYILAKLLRSSAKDQMAVTVEEEIGFCDLYLSLFKIRYAENFSYTFEIDPDILQLGMIKHLFQPILENYLIHGFRPERKDNQLTLKGIKEGEDLIVTIEDNGSGMTELKLIEIRQHLDYSNPAKDSIGMSNVNERIKIAFGKQYGLSVTSLKNQGTVVTIVFPAKLIKEVQQDVQGSNSR